MLSSMRHLARLNNISRIQNCFANRIDKCFYKSTAINRKDDNKKNDLSGSAASKYDVFIDDESPIIFDIEQEREKYFEVNDDVGRAGKKRKEFTDISPERGVTGVIEIDELASILKRENAIDLTVIKIPADFHYVDYMVLVSGKSRRHMKAMAEFVRRIYKYKTKAIITNIPAIEGINSNDWMALDLGNIALHIMSKSAREMYNLESFWALSREFDLQSKMQIEAEETDFSNILENLTSSVNK